MNETKKWTNNPQRIIEFLARVTEVQSKEFPDLSPTDAEFVYELLVFETTLQGCRKRKSCDNMSH